MHHVGHIDESGERYEVASVNADNYDTTGHSTYSRDLAAFYAAANHGAILALLDEVDGLREALWVCAEHNALHFGESHNTVIQARAALKENT